jgi:hypothetical protein
MAKGSVKINDHTARVVKDVENFSLNGLRDYIDTSLSIIKKLAPIDTGNHRSMIDQREEGAGFIIFSGSGYGQYLEFGTAHMVAQPHFVPGLARARQEFEDGGRWAG